MPRDLNLAEIRTLDFADALEAFPFLTPSDLATAARRWNFEPDERAADGSPKPFHVGRMYLDRPDRPARRSAVVFGSNRKRPAVLYVWSDNRVVNIHAHRLFLRLNTDPRLTAPALYGIRVKNPHQGSSVMEKIEGYTTPFDRPDMDDEGRRTFFGLLVRALEAFGRMNSRELFIEEGELGPTGKFLDARINRWRGVAESNGWIPREYPEVYARLAELQARVVDALATEPLVLMHPHLFPRQLWQREDGRYVVTSFDAAYRPHVYAFTKHPWQFVLDWGYERGVGPRLTPERAVAECEAWMRLAVDEGIPPPRFAAGMCERALGAFLADLGGSLRDEGVRRHQVRLWTAILDHFEPLLP